MADLTQINSENCKLIKDLLLNGENTEWEACKIYFKLVDDETEEHNCIGCQFVDLHKAIYINFDAIDVSGLSEEFYFKTYLFWLYQNVERIYELFELVNPKSNNPVIKTFFEKNLIATKQIKRWTNFVKHPKAFQFAHHPKYVYETDDQLIPQGSIVLDTERIEYFYSGDKKNKELHKLISKKSNVIVKIPDLNILTELFCQEFTIFTNWICENEMIAEFLKDETTIENYYENELL